MADPKFTRNPVPPPPAGAARLRPDQLPGGDRPPVRMGKVIVSDYTREQLKRLGWQEGDPIPGDLGERIASLRKEMQSEMSAAEVQELEAAKKRKPLSFKVQDISELPPEKQAELRAYLQQYKVEMEQQRAINEAEQAQAAQDEEDGVSPELAQQFAQANAAVSGYAQSQTAPTPPPGVKIPEGKVYAGAIGPVSDIPEKIERIKQAQATAEAPQPAAAAAAPPNEEGPLQTNAPPLVCPHCLRDVNAPRSIKPTQDELEQFQAVQLDFTGKSRFTKAYPLQSGASQVIVTFRDLLSKESLTVSQKVASDVRTQIIIGDAEYIGMVHDYRLCLSLKRIEAGGDVLVDVPSLEDFAKDRGITDLVKALPQFRDWIYAEVLTRETARLAVGKCYQRFHDLIMTLNDTLNDPNF